jgi:hypothetical protein
VIVFILCSDPVYSMSSFVFCSVNWPNSYIVLCDMCHLLLLCVFVYVICFAILYYHCQSNNNNNSIQLFIIYVPSQQPQGQLQTQHSTDIHNYIMDTHNIKSRVNCRST